MPVCLALDEHMENGRWPFHTYTLRFAVSCYLEKCFHSIKKGKIKSHFRACLQMTAEEHKEFSTVKI